jgi:hypothetical protein
MSPAHVMYERDMAHVMNERDIMVQKDNGGHDE